MTKRTRKNTRSVNEVMTEAQAITDNTPLDHGTQFGSWTKVETSTEDETVDDLALEGIAAELEAAPAETITEPAPLFDAEEGITFESSPLGVPLLAEPTDEQVDAAAENELTAEIGPEAQPEDQIVTFDSLIAKLDPAQVDEMVLDLADELDARAAYEREVGPDNESIHKSLKKARAAFVASKDTARVLLATNTTAGFINRSVSEGARYNVYALGKLADLVKGLTEGQISNAINLACMKSLFALRNAGVPFTSKAAKAAASDKIHDIDAAVKKHLIRHTVSASTAPTQASSTMQALETLGIVTRSGSVRDSVWNLTDHPAVKKLEEKLGFASAA